MSIRFPFLRCAIVIAFLLVGAEQPFADRPQPPTPIPPPPVLCPECQPYADDLVKAKTKERELKADLAVVEGKVQITSENITKTEKDIKQALKSYQDLVSSPTTTPDLELKKRQLISEIARLKTILDFFQKKIAEERVTLQDLSADLKVVEEDIKGLEEALKLCNENCKKQQQKKTTQMPVEPYSWSVTLSAGPCAPGSRELSIVSYEGFTSIVDARPSLPPTGDVPTTTPNTTGDSPVSPTIDKPSGASDVPEYKWSVRSYERVIGFNTGIERTIPQISDSGTTGTTGGSPDIGIGDKDKKEQTQEPPPEEPEETKDQPPPTGEKPKATVEVLLRGQNVDAAIKDSVLQVEGQPPPLPKTADSQPDAVTGSQDDPIHVKPDQDGRIEFTVPGTQQVQYTVDTTPTDSTLVAFDAKPQEFGIKVGYQLAGLGSQADVRQIFTDGQRIYTNLEYPRTSGAYVTNALGDLTNVAYSEPNPCQGPEEIPNDPYFSSKSSWKQDFDDQWAIKRVGYTADPNSPWNLKLNKNPVVVAVVDTGLDWNHLDISWDSIWTNKKEIPENGMDDDKNGYVDDHIGWDFYMRNNMPWDHNGHGTFVTGIIAATPGNKEGIAGINPYAKIMVLKALNGLGHTRASYVAEAIIYAANNGAKVINLSVGGYELTRTQQLAVDFARSKGVVVVAAAGNKAIDVSKYGPAGLKGVLTVAASDFQDKRAVYSNFGSDVDISAPGNDVLSLRARRTDLLLDIPEVKYTAGSAYIGVDKRYYRASGTSFAAPIVAATAALLFSANPELTNEDVERMLLYSARDVDAPGKDGHTGYGILDAKAALKADPKFFLIAEISGVQVVAKEGKQFVQVSGIADADRFKTAYLEIGAGKNPTAWKKISGELKQPVRNGTVGLIPATELAGSADWTIRLLAQHQNGRTNEGWFYLKLK